MRTFRGTADFTSNIWPQTDEGTDKLNPDPTAWNTGDKTTWSYDPATGLLLSKTDPAGKAISYAYTQLSQIKTKTWARGVTATYKYYGDDPADAKTGELKSIDYSDTPNTNPDISYTYNRLGKVASVADATGTRSFAYDPSLTTLQSETLPSLFNSGTDSRLLTEKYDTTNTGTKGRSTGFSLGTASTTTSDYDVTYGYDTYGRGGTVTAGGTTFTYAYTPSSNLVGSVTNGTYAQTRTWMPNRDLLASIDTKMGTTSKATFAYACDEWGRRTSAIRSGEVYSRYINQGLVTTWGYDDRSQVTSSQTYYGQTLTDLSYPVEGRNYGFTFDNIGNRLTSTIDSTRSTTYNNNALNQITDRGTPGSIDVAGFAPTGSSVTVSGTTTVDRQGDYYHAVSAVDNSGKGVNASISVTSTNPTPTSTITRQIFLAKGSLAANEKWQYDADGNLTQDDQWTYSWSAENRLIAMQTRPDLITTGVFAAADARWIEFKYDYLGRRAEKIVHAGWDTTNNLYASVQSDTRFVYHGWNLVAEYSVPTPGSIVLGRTYTWGLDLSGTLAGDGGTGGLLLTQDGTYKYVYAYDGNGNVSAVMLLSTGATVAEYEYGAFGEPLRASNVYAQTNPFRYSTQYSDNETGLLYYGHRYYNSQSGRFLVRDGTEEAGGLNLYGFCGNNGVNRWDLLGNGPYDMYYSATPTISAPHAGMIWSGNGWVTQAQWDFNRSMTGEHGAIMSSGVPGLATADSLMNGAYMGDTTFYGVNTGPSDPNAKFLSDITQGNVDAAAEAASSKPPPPASPTNNPNPPKPSTDSSTAGNTSGTTAPVASNSTSGSDSASVKSNATSDMTVGQFLNFKGTAAPTTTSTPAPTFDASLDNPGGSSASNNSLDLSSIGSGIILAGDAAIGAPQPNGKLTYIAPGSMDYAVGDAHDLTTARDAKYLTGGVEGQTFDLASTNGGVVAFVVNRDGFQVALDLHGGPGGVGTIRGNGVVNLTDDQWAAMNGHVSTLYILSCDFASGPNGQSRVNHVADLTGATVYASPYPIVTSPGNPAPRTSYPPSMNLPDEKPGWVRLIKSGKG